MTKKKLSEPDAQNSHFAGIVYEMIDFMSGIEENERAESEGFKKVYSFLQFAYFSPEDTIGKVWTKIEKEEKSLKKGKRHA